MRFFLDYILPSVILAGIWLGVGWIIIKLITLIISLSWAWWLIYFSLVAIFSVTFWRTTK